MSGYLFTFSDEDSLFESMKYGRYSTLMSAKWSSPHLPTLADFVTMSPGDRVYFFSKRMVYGIGEIVSLNNGDVVLKNRTKVTEKGVLPIAAIDDRPIIEDPEPPQDESARKAYRWVIMFQPSPYLFARGIDMDDLLSTNKTAFRSLRTFEKRTFIELDDEEELAFRTAILRRNIDVLRQPNELGIIAGPWITEHCRITDLAKDGSRTLEIGKLIASYRKSNGRLSAEAALELALLWQLGPSKDATTSTVFGDWDYLSHQVAASPPKSIQWMDRMDIFGYKWLDSTDKIIEKYLVMELKQGVVCGDDLNQLMKYVDWIGSEYANGDYSLISAYLVGHSFDMTSITSGMLATQRYSLMGYRPPVFNRWSAVTLVSYYAEPNGHVLFEEVPTTRT